jgi:UPF0755 protein
MLRKLLLIGAVVVALAAIGVVLAVNALTERMETPFRGHDAPERFVDIEPGTSTIAIARQLAAAGIVPDDWTFRLAVRRSGRDRSLQAGEYRFETALSPMGVVDKITSGRVHLRQITFPEGLVISEMAAIFEAEGLGTREAFIEAAGRTELIADLDAGASNLEGYLFPETYSLPRDATADTLVEAMVTQFRDVFTDELRAEAEARRMNVREVVTLASLIQMETGQADEHDRVSAVYNNRLRIGMPMQCDPTVIYALRLAGLYDGNLTRANLEFDSPYNTYRYGGLPPGPIAAAGGAALRAALHPADVSYLYFVSRNDGSHAFANTLREHINNVREFQVEYFRRRRGQ